MSKDVVKNAAIAAVTFAVVTTVAGPLVGALAATVAGKGGSS